MYELDLTLWRFLKNLAYRQPELAADQFKIKLDTARQIAQASEPELRKLASGELLSFRLDTPEKDLIHFLEKPDGIDFLKYIDAAEAFNAKHYYSSLNLMAIDDIDMACLCFCVSRQFAQAIAQASFMQIETLANTVLLQFSLSCTERPILDYLKGKDSAHALIKKQLSILERG